MAELPNAREAERALIGAALNLGYVPAGVLELITVDDFHAPTHQHIWQAIVDVSDGARCDAVTVMHHLAEHGHTGEHFQAAALLDLQNACPALSNGVRYAQQIAAARLRRDLINASAEVSRLAWEGDDAGDAADAARSMFAHLDMPGHIGAPDPDVDSFIDAVDMRIDWLLPGFLERGDRLLITAAEGVGKSMLLTQIGVQAACGVHPWTLAEVPPVNVTIVDCENGGRLVARRLAKFRQLAGPRLDPQRLRIHARPEGLDLTTRADRLWLMDRCRANATELLIIGPAYRLSAGVAAKGDVGGEDHARTVTKALDECRNRFGITLLMETHAPHGGISGRDLRPFGSSVWLRWPEFGLGIAQDPDNSHRYELRHWRGPRDERVWPRSLRKEGRWPWTAAEMPTGTFNGRGVL